MLPTSRSPFSWPHRRPAARCSGRSSCFRRRARSATDGTARAVASGSRASNWKRTRCSRRAAAPSCCQQAWLLLRAMVWGVPRLLQLSCCSPAEPAAPLPGCPAARTPAPPPPSLERQHRVQVAASRPALDAAEARRQQQLPVLVERALPAASLQAGGAAGRRTLLSGPGAPLGHPAASAALHCVAPPGRRCPPSELGRMLYIAFLVKD
jgi:hypothetical protein